MGNGAVTQPPAPARPVRFPRERRELSRWGEAWHRVARPGSIEAGFACRFGDPAKGD